MNEIVSSDGTVTLEGGKKDSFFSSAGRCCAINNNDQVCSHADHQSDVTRGRPGLAFRDEDHFFLVTTEARGASAGTQGVSRDHLRARVSIRYASYIPCRSPLPTLSRSHSPSPTHCTAPDALAAEMTMSVTMAPIITDPITTGPTGS